jgi:hypothetical protein
MKDKINCRKNHEVFDKHTGHFVTKFITHSLIPRLGGSHRVLDPNGLVSRQTALLKSRTISTYHNLLTVGDMLYGYIDKNGVVWTFMALPGENGITKGRGRRIPNGLPYGRAEYEPLTNYVVVITMEFSSSLPKVTLTL